MKLFFIILVIIVLLGAGYSAYRYLKQDPPDALIEALTKTAAPPSLPSGVQAPVTVPPGFTATIYSKETPGARVLVRDPKGTLLASLTSEGKVVALPDFDADGQADETKTVLEGLNKPHGLLVVCPDTGNTSADQDACVLYVAETDALRSYAYDADTQSVRNQQTLAVYPSGDGHFTRTLLMQPDGQQLLLSIGSSCNVCVEKDWQRAAVLSYDLQTKELSPFATGLRNTVFMAADPVTGEVWGTDNGRDVLGDDTPPDEVNILHEGDNYGWPYCYGDQTYDADFNQETDAICATTQSPHIVLQAHSAALGLAFVPEEGWPEDMRNDLLVAYHGSWNRSTSTGYKVVWFDLESTGTRSAQNGPVDFVTGFLAEGGDPDDAIGRPVGILTEPGGVVFISDDRAGAIYRIAYTGE